MWESLPWIIKFGLQAYFWIGVVVSVIAVLFFILLSTRIFK